MNLETLLRRMVEIESVFPEEQELACFLEDYLEDQGFEVERVPVEEGRFCLVADRGDPSIGFYGHIDTVPVQGDWSRDPFEPEVEDGRMYGLGAFDMLGGVASMLVAANQADEDIRIMLAVDEELYSRGAYQLIEEGYTGDVELLVVPEIADTREDEEFPTAILGRRGRAVVEVEVDGEPAHGARPEEGVNAIQRTREVLERLEDIETRNHSELDEETVFVRSISSQAESLSIPETAQLELDAHIVPPTTPESFLERVRDLLPSYASAELGERPNPSPRPYVVEPEEVSLVLDSLRERGELNISYGLSVADENVLAQEVPVVVIGPEGGNPHDADEWVDLDSLDELVETYRRFLQNLSENTGIGGYP